MEEKDNPVQKVVIDEGELDDIKIYGILGLENLPRAVLIDWECWNLTAIVDKGEVTRNINRKRPGVLQAYKCPFCDTFFQQACEIF